MGDWPAWLNGGQLSAGHLGARLVEKCLAANTASPAPTGQTERNQRPNLSSRGSSTVPQPINPAPNAMISKPLLAANHTLSRSFGDAHHQSGRCISLQGVDNLQRGRGKTVNNNSFPNKPQFILKLNQTEFFILRGCHANFSRNIHENKTLVLRIHPIS